MSRRPILADRYATPLIAISAALAVSSCSGVIHEPGVMNAVQPVPDSSKTYSDPQSACTSHGAKYLGEMKCQFPDGSIATILSGEDAARAAASSVPVPPGSPHAWALATTALLFQLDGYRHDLLGGDSATPDARQRATMILSQWWSINNRDDLVKQLEWLQFRGHRQAFEEMGRVVAAMSDAQFISAKLAIPSEEASHLDFVRIQYRALGSKGILAWDLIRYISVCRWGYLAGYFSEAEAWDRVMPAAARLQQTFASWQDVQNDYLIGRVFWSDGDDAEQAKLRAIYDRFLGEPNSPWNLNEWRMDLGGVGALPIIAEAEQQGARQP